MSIGDKISRSVKNPQREPFKKPPATPNYPHRITIDITADQYTWVKDTAWQQRLGLAAFVRRTFDYLATHEDALRDIEQWAKETEPQ